MMDMRAQQLAGGITVYISGAHRFGTDAFLLSDFARARAGEIACDLCAGCGIVAALWFRRAENSPRMAYGVEIQEDAAEMMRRSAADSGLCGRLLPVCGDLRQCASLPLAAGTFDLVSCNPPYKQLGRGIPSTCGAQYLQRHEAACTLADVCAAAKRLLRFGGRLCICQRPERLADALEAMRAQGIEPKQLRFVQQKPQTAPWLFLLTGKRGGKPFLKVDPPLITESREGGVSAELERIYMTQ